MVRCSACDTPWPDDIRVCPRDGTRLGAPVAAAAATAPTMPAGMLLAPRPPDPKLPAGTMVGDYRVERELGTGGMGTVYAAVHPLIGKRVALKVMAAGPSGRPIEVQRFVREARAANLIGHPSVADVFAFGQLEDGRNYFVMELLEGETLGARLGRDRRLSLADAAAVVEEIARPLEAAHAKGIVHRDLKPENVFLLSAGVGELRLKLLDFGVAKLIGEDNAVRWTQTGEWVGTPLYIAPEQAQSQPIDGRADVYSLGVMLFEMLAGRTPFVGDNPMDVILAHVSQPAPRIASLVPGLPLEVDALLDRMLAKAPAIRPTLAEVRTTLRSAVQGAGGAVAARARRGRRGALVALALVVAAAAIGWAVLAGRAGPGASGTTIAALGPADAGVARMTAVAAADAAPAPPIDAAPAPPIDAAPAPPIDAAPAPPPRKPPRKPRPTRIVVELVELGATARIDGLVVTAGEPIEVKPGPHLVVVRGPRFKPFRTRIEVKAGKTEVVRPVLEERRFRLRPDRLVQPPTGTAPPSAESGDRSR